LSNFGVPGIFDVAFGLAIGSAVCFFVWSSGSNNGRNNVQYWKWVTYSLRKNWINIFILLARIKIFYV